MSHICILILVLSIWPGGWTTSVLEAALESNNASIALALVLTDLILLEILSDVNSLSLDKSEGRGAAVVVAT